jgi:hypothetical protein
VSRGDLGRAGTGRACGIQKSLTYGEKLMAITRNIYPKKLPTIKIE